jgi:hypothetical protein
MNVFRRHNFTRLSKAVVVFLSVLLVSAVGAALVHVTETEHAYCESHRSFEHADENGQSLEHQLSGQQALEQDAHAQLTDGDEHLPPDDSSDESCDWLTWLQGPSVPLPELHASLIDLPPPADTLAAAPLAQQANIPSQIDLLRLSPGHSPPVLTHISA